MSLGSTKLRDAAVGTRRVVPRGRASKRPAPSGRMLAVWGSPIVRLVRAHPGKAAAVVLLGTLMTGIVGNAVLFQHGHHPAPLFAGAPPQAGGPAGVTASDTPVGSVPLPMRRPPDLSPRTDAPPAVAPAPESAPVPAKPPAAIAAKRKSDGIATLLRDDPPAAGTTPPDASVLQAQRALGKLGFAIKPDGHMGSATRKALDSFVAERHVSGMTGTLTPKLLHDLALAAAKPLAAKKPPAAGKPQG